VALRCQGVGTSKADILSWEGFIRAAVGDDCIQEEIRLQSKGKINKCVDNENVALIAEGKGKSSSRSELLVEEE